MKKEMKINYSAPEITLVAVVDSIQCLCSSNGSEIDPFNYDDSGVQWE